MMYTLQKLVQCPVFVQTKLSSALQPVPTAASVTGVTYSVSDSSHECPCKRRKRRKMRTDIETNKYTVYVSYSAVNISVIAKNAAGRSPPAVIEEPSVPVADLKSVYLMSDIIYTNA